MLNNEKNENENNEVQHKKVLSKDIPTNEKRNSQPYDMTFNLEESYFYQAISKEEWEEIISI